MSLNSLNDLYVEQLRDLYSAESQLVDALPKMAKAANAKNLQEAFEQHLTVTREQKERLEQIFNDLGKSPSGKHCVAMEGLIKEGQELIEKKGQADADVLDAGLIAAAQRVEHYEIAGYGTVATWAQQLGREEDAQVLGRTLDEEEKTDKKLSNLAEGNINVQAQGQ